MTRLPFPAGALSPRKRMSDAIVTHLIPLERIGGIGQNSVLRELNAAGFDGWAGFEQDVDPARPAVDPQAGAARGRAYLRQAAGL